MNADRALYMHLKSGLAGTASVARDVPADFPAALPLVTVTRTSGDYDGFTDTSDFEVLMWAATSKELEALRDSVTDLIADMGEWVGGCVASSVKGSYRDDDATRGLPRWSVTADISYQD